MRLKASWIAWVFFGFVCLGVIQNVINTVSNPKPGTDSFSVAGDLVVDGFIPIVFALVGALIISRQPRNLIGWLMLGPAAFSYVVNPFLPDVQSWTAAPSQATLSVYLTLWFKGWDWLLLIFPVFLIMLLFPTGRPPSRRWNWVGYLALGMVAVFLFACHLRRYLFARRCVLDSAKPDWFHPLIFFGWTGFHRALDGWIDGPGSVVCFFAGRALPAGKPPRATADQVAIICLWVVWRMVCTGFDLLFIRRCDHPWYRHLFFTDLPGNGNHSCGDCHRHPALPPVGY